MFAFVFGLVLRRVRVGTHTHTHIYIYIYRCYVIQSVNEVTRTERDNGDSLDRKIFVSVGFFFI